MNHFPKMAWIALIAAASAGAQAQTPMGKTREDVRQELIAAVRNGTLPRGEAMGESMPANALKQPVIAGRTRADVLAELDAARRNGDLLASGDILAAGESGVKLNEVHPGSRSRAAMPVYAGAAGQRMQ